jgi:hypothetical protein
MLEFIRGLQVVNPIRMEYSSIAATGDVNHADMLNHADTQNHADMLHSVFWKAQPRGNRFALPEDISRCTSKVVFATELLDLTN